MNVMLDHITHNGNKVSYEKLWKTFLPTRTHTSQKWEVGLGENGSCFSKRHFYFHRKLDPWHVGFFDIEPYCVYSQSEPGDQRFVQLLTLRPFFFLKTTDSSAANQPDSNKMHRVDGS